MARLVDGREVSHPLWISHDPDESGEAARVLSLCITATVYCWRPVSGSPSGRLPCLKFVGHLGAASVEGLLAWRSTQSSPDPLPRRDGLDLGSEVPVPLVSRVRAATACVPQARQTSGAGPPMVSVAMRHHHQAVPAAAEQSLSAVAAVTRFPLA